MQKRTTFFVKRHRICHKRGQALPLNTIILIILVVLVLIVVAAFFLGGTATLMDIIREILYGSIAGTDRVLAVSNCGSRCSQLRLLPDSALKGSAYCQEFERIDEDNNGEAEYEETSDGKKKYVKYFCWNKDTRNTDNLIETLDVSCSYEIYGQSYSPDVFCNGQIPKP